MSEAVLDTKKIVDNKPNIKRLELEYFDMNYIIVNFEEHVIDFNGNLWEYSFNKDVKNNIDKLIWEYEDIDEFEYWPDKSGDHAPMATKWRIIWYDEFDTYYSKSGATKMPEKLDDLVNLLKKLK